MFKLLSLLLLLSPLMVSCSPKQEPLSLCALRSQQEARAPGKSPYFTHVTQGEDENHVIFHFNKNGKKWTTNGFCEDETKNSCELLPRDLRLKDPECIPYVEELDKAEAEEKARHKQVVAKANAAASKRYRELAPLRDRCKTLGYLLDGPTYPFEVGDHDPREDGWMDRWVENDCDEVLGLSKQRNKPTWSGRFRDR